jgi:hypothetical protein
VERGEYRQQTEVESVGWYIVSGERDAENNTRVRGFAPSQSESVTVSIRIPGVGVYDTAEAFVYSPFAHEYKPLEKLDPDLRKAIEESVRKARSSGDGDGIRPRLR